MINSKVQLHAHSINSNDVLFFLICFKSNKTFCQVSLFFYSLHLPFSLHFHLDIELLFFIKGELTPGAEVEGQYILEFKSEEELCDHKNDYKSSDESIDDRLPKHECLSLGGTMMVMVYKKV